MPMPVSWIIDSRTRTVDLLAEGEVSLEQVTESMGAVAGAKALSYGKLVDVRKGTASMTADELKILLVACREYHHQGPMGPLAVLATDTQSVTHARLLRALALAGRPMKLFTREAPARRWMVRAMGPVP